MTGLITTKAYGKGAYPLFIDSGAFSLYNEHVLKNNMRDGFKWFEGDGFKEYLDKYAEFIKMHADVIDLYASVDVIFNPELTWKSQQYLEQEHGLKPVPTIHFNTPLKWIRHYLDKGYDYIALGGLGQDIGVQSYIYWADQVFNVICDQQSRLPVCKVHGFAMTSTRLMRRWPWYSVDSTRWLLIAAYGEVILPPMRNGVWVYDETPHIVRVSSRPAEKKGRGILDTNTQLITDEFERYIQEKGFIIGESKIENGEEVIITRGLCNDSMKRCELNVCYFLDFLKSIPEWPWAFKKKQGGLGLEVF